MEKFIPFPGNTAYTLLESFNADAQAQWGKMNAWQMLEHLILPLRISRGELVVDLTTPEDKVEKVKLLFLLSELPLKRGVAAPFLKEDFLPYMFGSFEEAKANLKTELDQFFTYWEENPNAKHTHPVFGSLNKSEWFRFQSKHFTHHFTQFGSWSE